MMLYIVRHAWASYFGDPQWPDDTLRPLTEKGKARFSKVVPLLAERGFSPQVIATSPYIRCRETADLIAQLLPSRPDVTALDDLAPGGDPDGLLRWINSQLTEFSQVAVVGHAPDVGYFAAALVGNDEDWIRFAKGAVAAIEFQESVAPGEGELQWLNTAKTLGC